MQATNHPPCLVQAMLPMTHFKFTRMSTATWPLKSNGKPFYARVGILGSDTTITTSLVSVSCTQSSFSSSVLLASLFGCLLFTYKLRRRGIPIACLLTRMMLLEYQWVKKSVTSFTGRWKKPLGFRSIFDRRPVWPCIVQGNSKWMHEIEKNNGKLGWQIIYFIF